MTLSNAFIQVQEDEHIMIPRRSMTMSNVFTQIPEEDEHIMIPRRSYTTSSHVFHHEGTSLDALEPGLQSRLSSMGCSVQSRSTTVTDHSNDLNMQLRYHNSFLHFQDVAAGMLVQPRSQTSPPSVTDYLISQDDVATLEQTHRLVQRLESEHANLRQQLAVIAATATETLPTAVESEETPREETCMKMPVPPAAFNGSLGHPEFCARPCIYAARGNCTSGDSCAFCHIPHKGTPKLDKKQRASLQEMQTAEVIELIIASLRCKVKWSKGQLRLQSLMDFLQQELQHNDPAIPRRPLDPEVAERKRRDTQSIQSVLTKTSIASIMCLIKAPPFRPEFHAEVEVLLDELKMSYMSTI